MTQSIYVLTKRQDLKKFWKVNGINNSILDRMSQLLDSINNGGQVSLTTAFSAEILRMIHTTPEWVKGTGHALQQLLTAYHNYCRDGYGNVEHLLDESNLHKTERLNGFAMWLEQWDDQMQRRKLKVLRNLRPSHPLYKRRKELEEELGRSPEQLKEHPADEYTALDT